MNLRPAPSRFAYDDGRRAGSGQYYLDHQNQRFKSLNNFLINKLRLDLTYYQNQRFNDCITIYPLLKSNEQYYLEHLSSFSLSVPSVLSWPLPVTPSLSHLTHAAVTVDTSSFPGL